MILRIVWGISEFPLEWIASSHKLQQINPNFHISRLSHTLDLSFLVTLIYIRDIIVISELHQDFPSTYVNFYEPTHFFLHLAYYIWVYNKRYSFMPHCPFHHLPQKNL